MRKRDYVWPAIGALTLAAAFAVGCNNGGVVSGPTVGTPETAAPAPIAAAPAPQKVSPPPPSGKTFDLWGESGKLYVRNNGSVRAEIVTFRTTFDDQTTELEAQAATVEPGATLERGFSVAGCFQGDADQRGVKLIGGIFFDKQGNPFVPSRSPEKVAECRYREPEPEPTPTPNPEPTPTPSPEPTPTPSPSPTPTPQPTPTPTPQPTPTPTPQPTPTPTPAPVCANTTATSSAAQGFELANSGDATELAWVTANVALGPFKLLDKDENGEEFNDGNGCISGSEVSFGASVAKAALVKAGKKYRYYLNVVPGALLCSYDGKDISHVSYFGCK